MAIGEKYESLEELAESLRTLPINWHRVRELGIVWARHQTHFDEDNRAVAKVFPNVRIVFHDPPH